MQQPELIENPHRVLVIDDNPAIHQDFRKILVPESIGSDLASAEAELFGTQSSATVTTRFDIDSAYQGQDGLAKVEAAVAEGRPYSLAFVDVRMPPGWDGVETIRRIWEQTRDLQVVICTAYSDYSWDAMVECLGQSENLLILKKPFDSVEVLQLAHSLTRKYVVTQQANLRMADLDRLVQRRTAELTTANTNLQREVEQRARAQEALLLSEERFSKAFQATPIPLAILRRARETVDNVNEGFLQLSALDHASVIHRRLEDLRLWRDPSVWPKWIQTLKQGEKVRHQPAETLRPDGSVRQVRVSLETIEVGGDACLLILAEDITEQTLLERQLLQSQKMESIGQLAAGVAHDFNNLLTIIQGHASLHAANDKLDQDVLESLREVNLAAERASGLTRQLLAFSRKQVSQAQRLDVAGLVRKLEQMLRRLLGEHIEFECVCGRVLPPILGEETGIEQVLMNLVVNARDAMPQGGRITLRTEPATVSAAAAADHPGGRPGRFVCLEVEDNGSGIPSELLTRIYEPFFTTKDVGKGTGLGLSTVYAIVKQHRGWLEVTSVVGQGTRFRVFLPELVSSSPEEKGGHTTLFVKRHTELRGKETVLLVDDEGPLRDMATRALQLHGYLVLQAEDGHRALQMWEQSGGAVDLLFTDVVLPQGLDGVALAKRLQAKKPNLKTLLSSGYSAELGNSDFVLVEGVNYLPKPYDVQKLIGTVRRCLDAVEVPVGAQLSPEYEPAEQST